MEMQTAVHTSPSRKTMTIFTKSPLNTSQMRTDYDNWAVVWTKSGTVLSYNVVTRKPNMEGQFQGSIEEVLSKVDMKKADFKAVPNEDCSKKDAI